MWHSVFLKVLSHALFHFFLIINLGEDRATIFIPIQGLYKMSQGAFTTSQDRKGTKTGQRPVLSVPSSQVWRGPGDRAAQEGAEAFSQRCLEMPGVHGDYGVNVSETTELIKDHLGLVSSSGNQGLGTRVWAIDGSTVEDKTQHPKLFSILPAPGAPASLLHFRRYGDLPWENIPLRCRWISKNQSPKRACWYQLCPGKAWRGRVGCEQALFGFVPETTNKLC